jgi:hypothetical protein
MITPVSIRFKIGNKWSCVTVGPWFYDDLVAVHRDHKALMKANKDVLNPGPCVHDCYFAHCGSMRTITRDNRELYVNTMNAKPNGHCFVEQRKEGFTCRCGCEVLRSNNPIIFYHPTPSTKRKEAYQIEAQNKDVYDCIFRYYMVKIGNAAPIRRYLYLNVITFMDLYPGQVPQNTVLYYGQRKVGLKAKIEDEKIPSGSELVYAVAVAKKATQLDPNSCCVQVLDDDDDSTATTTTTTTTTTQLQGPPNEDETVQLVPPTAPAQIVQQVADAGLAAFTAVGGEGPGEVNGGRDPPPPQPQQNQAAAAVQGPKELLDGHIYGVLQMCYYMCHPTPIRVWSVSVALLIMFMFFPWLLTLMVLGVGLATLSALQSVQQDRYEITTPSDLRLVINQNVQRVDRPFVVVVWRFGWGRFYKSISYVPHIVDCLISESAFDTSDTLHANLLVRARRLASFPMPDFWHTGLFMGSIDVAESVIRSQGFRFADEYAQSSLIQVGASPLAIERQRYFTQNQRLREASNRDVLSAVVIGALILVLCVMVWRLTLHPFQQMGTTQTRLERGLPDELIASSPSPTYTHSEDLPNIQQSSSEPFSIRSSYQRLKSGSPKPTTPIGGKNNFGESMRRLKGVDQLSASEATSIASLSWKTIPSINQLGSLILDQIISKCSVAPFSRLSRISSIISQGWLSVSLKLKDLSAYAPWYREKTTSIMQQIIQPLRVLLPPISWKLLSFSSISIVGVDTLGLLSIFVILWQASIDVVRVMHNHGRLEPRVSLAICVLHLVTHLLTTWSYAIGFTCMILQNYDASTSLFWLRVTMVFSSLVVQLTRFGSPSLALLPRYLARTLLRILTFVISRVPMMVLFCAILLKCSLSLGGQVHLPRGDGLLEIVYSRLSVFLGSVNATDAQF